MPLPKNPTPTYELEIPSSKKIIKYRPFLVKEEKILIIAMESQDQKQIANAVKSVIANCIVSRGVKVDELSKFKWMAAGVVAISLLFVPVVTDFIVSSINSFTQQVRNK